jgi:dethiobiotin synthetase
VIAFYDKKDAVLVDDSYGIMCPQQRQGTTYQVARSVSADLCVMQ